jgi:DNA-binding LytR/AlgR family response regulator
LEEKKLYNIAICDDNNIFLKLLSETIKSEFLNHEVDVKIFTFNNGRSLISAVESREQYFNFIFLDINMPEIDGFSTAKRLVEIDKEFLLLFITNLDSCATEGYKYNAFRYIIKSRLKDDLKEAIDNIVLKMNWFLQICFALTMQFLEKITTITGIGSQ